MRCGMNEDCGDGGADLVYAERRMRQHLIALFVVAALMPWPLLITEDHWWAFILVTAAILAALRLLFGPDWTSFAGLNVSPLHGSLAIVAFLLIATGSEVLLRHVYQTAAVRAGAPSINDQIGFLFQAFNEEVLFRALLIGLFIQLIPSVSVISFGMAFLFAGAHFLLYRFGALHTALSIAALATLFLAGVALNNLYFAFRHIGFSWALHAGWNVVWLPAAFYDATTNERLHEPQVFDRVLGSPIVVVTACAIAALSIVFLARRRAVGAYPIGEPRADARNFRSGREFH